jgi:histidinol-phosphate phosphatase family protein
VRAAVFVDRDGVLNELVPRPVSGDLESPLDSEQVVLMPGAAAAVRRLHDAGYAVVQVSNQPAAALGDASIEQIESVQRRFLEVLDAAGARLDAFRRCLHHPDSVVPELRRVCECRKPAPGMLLDAATELNIDLRRSWMIGDIDTDILAGAAAGCRTILIENPASRQRRNGKARPDAVVDDLAAAVEVVLSTGQPRREPR